MGQGNYRSVKMNGIAGTDKALLLVYLPTQEALGMCMTVILMMFNSLI